MLPLQKYDHERPKGPIYLSPRHSGLGFKGSNLEPQALKGRATRVEFVRFDYLLRSAQQLVTAPWRARPSGLASLSIAWTLGVAQGWDRSPLRVYRYVVQLQMSASRVARKIRGRIYEPSDLTPVRLQFQAHRILRRTR